MNEREKLLKNANEKSKIGSRYYILRLQCIESMGRKKTIRTNIISRYSMLIVLKISLCW